jgi:hypothetical protein
MLAHGPSNGCLNTMKTPFARFFFPACVALCLSGHAGAATSVVVTSNGEVIQQTSTGNGNSNVVVIDGKVVAASSSSPARGPIKTEHRDLQPFSVVELTAPANATFSVSPKTTISITGPSDALPKVATAVHDGRLTISTNESISLSQPLRIQISGPSLSGVRIPGSGTMKLAIPSGDALDLRISGSGSIQASGNVSSLRISLSGSGDINADILRAKTVDIELSGSGDVRAWAIEHADVDLSGSGDISIRGKPAQRNVDRSGSGDVNFD